MSAEAGARIASADFNNDSKADVLVYNYSTTGASTLAMLPGDGTLTDTALALGQRPSTVAAADLLGNGYPEILIGEADTDGQGYSLTVFQNQSTAWTTTLATPTVTVSPSPSSITTAQSTIVTVTVRGSVTLTSGTYTSTATTLSSGSAVITIPGSSLSVGTDTLTATYTPDSASASMYNSATGTGSVVVATPPTFALSNSGSISFAAGVTTGNTATITVTPSGGFTGSVTLAAALHLVQPAQWIRLPSASVRRPRSTSAAVQQPALSQSPLQPPRRARFLILTGERGVPWTGAGGATLAFVLLFGIPRRSRRWISVLGLFVILVSLTGAISSCGGNGNGGSGGNGGGGSSGNPGTTPGGYTVTVTGTSGSITETTTVNITVN